MNQAAPDMQNDGQNTASEPTLSPKQATALEALLTTPDLKAAAEKANIGEATIHRYLKEPAFTAQYQAARRVIMSRHLDTLTEAAGEAIAQLRRLLKDDKTPAASIVTSARVLLEAAIKIHADSRLEEIENRLIELENQK